MRFPNIVTFLLLISDGALTGAIIGDFSPGCLLAWIPLTMATLLTFVSDWFYV
jgi:hypothetical protein